MSQLKLSRKFPANLVSLLKLKIECMLSFRMLSGNGNADLPLPPARPPNWKKPSSVVGTLMRDFASGSGNSIINGFVIGEICCDYSWKEKNV